MSRSLLVWVYVLMSINVKPILPIHGKYKIYINIYIYIYIYKHIYISVYIYYNCYIYITVTYINIYIYITVTYMSIYVYSVFAADIHFTGFSTKTQRELSLEFHFNHCQVINSNNPYIDCPASLRAYHSAIFLKRLVVLALIKKV